MYLHLPDFVHVNGVGPEVAPRRDLRRGAKARHGREAVEALPLSRGQLLLLDRRGPSLEAVAASFGLVLLDWRHRGGAVAVAATGRAWGLVDVLAVDVHGIALEGRAPVAVAGVALLETEELELGLQFLHKTRHRGDRCGIDGQF